MLSSPNRDVNARNRPETAMPFPAIPLTGMDEVKDLFVSFSESARSRVVV